MKRDDSVVQQSLAQHRVVQQVVHLLHEGWTVRQIAMHLGIAERRMTLLTDEIEQRCFGDLVGVHDAADDDAAAITAESW